MLSTVRDLRSWAEERPDDLALAGPDLELSAGELWDTALRIAGWIRECGVRPDEAVGAAVPPTLHPAFFVALLIRGGTGALISSEVEVGPEAPIQRLITVGDAHRDLAPDVLLHFDDTAIARMSTLDVSTIDVASTAPDEVVTLAYSSGTTGSPKAIMRTAASIEGFISPRFLRLARSAYFMLHPGLMASAIAAFLAAIAVRRPHLTAGTAEQNLRMLRDRDIEVAEASPFQLDQLLAMARQAGERLPSLRELHSTGAPLSRELGLALADWFGAEVSDVYGSVEIGFVASRRVDEPDATEQGALVSDDVDVEIVDDRRQPIPEAQDGRVRLRSPGMAVGYVGNPDLGPYKGFHDGWFYPGDLGRLVDGRLTILGREDELINVGGRKIMPARVEELVLQQPGVREAVACAVTDRLGVRQLAIAIVGDPIEDPVGFAQQLRQPLGGILPSLIMRIGSIPRTEMGKPKRDAVAELLHDQLNQSRSVL